MAPLNDIVAGLDELSSKGKSSAWIDPGSRWCVTFEFRDSTTKGAPFWLQVRKGMLNMQYLDDDEPSSRLKEEVDQFPEALRPIAWDIYLYATFEMPQEYSPHLPALIDRIARQYFGLQQDYQVTYSVEHYGA